MKIKEFNELTQSQPDTQNTGMAQNQLLKIGQHAIKIENMIAGNQEISEWASNKINLASDYVKKIHNTLSGMYPKTYSSMGVSSKLVKIIKFIVEKWEHNSRRLLFSINELTYSLSSGLTSLISLLYKRILSMKRVI